MSPNPRRRLPLLLALLALAPYAAAGCLNGTDVPSNELGIGPRGFQATYADHAGTRFQFSLDGPQPILTNVGAFEEAYRLTKHAEGQPQPSLVVWIDRNLVVLREDFTCKQVFESECVETSTTWARAGRPSELYLDALAAVRQDRPLRYNLAGPWTSPDPTVRTTEDGIEIHIDWADAGQTQWANRAATVTAEDLTALPWTISTTVDGKPHHSLKLVSVELGARLDPIDTQVVWNTGPSAARAHLAFPGENSRPFDLGFSHRDIMKAVLDEVGWTDRENPEHVCVDYYELRPSANRDNLPAAWPDKPIGEVYLHADNEGKTGAWLATLRNRLGQLVVTDIQNQSTDLVSCNEMDISHEATVSADEFLQDAAARIPDVVSHSGFRYQTEPPTARAGNSEVPWRMYLYSARPSYTEGMTGVVGYEPYTFTIDASTGTLLTLETHPDRLSP